MRSHQVVNSPSCEAVQAWLARCCVVSHGADVVDIDDGSLVPGQQPIDSPITPAASVVVPPADAEQHLLVTAPCSKRDFARSRLRSRHRLTVIIDTYWCDRRCIPCWHLRATTPPERWSPYDRRLISVIRRRAPAPFRTFTRDAKSSQSELIGSAGAERGGDAERSRRPHVLLRDRSGRRR